MLKLAVNLSMMFTEYPMLERFSVARTAGFTAVEIQFPYEFDLKSIKQELGRNGLELILFNMPPGDLKRGDVGIAAHPGRVEEFREGVKIAMEWAKELGVRRLNCLAGKKLAEYSQQEQWETLKSNVVYSASVLEQHGVRLMVEPLNHYDVPGFLLNTSTSVIQLIAEINHSNIYLQYDVYHAHREAEAINQTLFNNLKKIGHIQIADDPGRHQPGTGKIDFRLLLQEILLSGYEGYTSLEYIPQPDTLTSLNWIKEFGLSW